MLRDEKIMNKVVFDDKMMGTPIIFDQQRP